MYNTGNIVNNIVLTMYGDRWLLDLQWLSDCKVYKCLNQCCTPETNTMYGNYN